MRGLDRCGGSRGNGLDARLRRLGATRSRYRLHSAERVVVVGIFDDERIARPRGRHRRCGTRGTRLEIEAGHRIAGSRRFFAASADEGRGQSDYDQQAQDDQNPPVLIDAIEQRRRRFGRRLGGRTRGGPRRRGLLSRRRLGHGLRWLGRRLRLGRRFDRRFGGALLSLGKARARQRYAVVSRRRGLKSSECSAPARPAQVQASPTTVQRVFLRA